MSFTFLLMLSTAATPAAAAEPLSTSAFGTTERVAAADLDRATAREDLSQVAVADQTSTVSNNTVSGTSTTGQVTIDGNAFQNLNGLAVISANSGNNVSINSSLTVNLRFTPAQ